MYPDLEYFQYRVAIIIIMIVITVVSNLHVLSYYVPSGIFIVNRLAISVRCYNINMIIILLVCSLEINWLQFNFQRLVQNRKSSVKSKLGIWIKLPKWGAICISRYSSRTVSVTASMGQHNYTMHFPYLDSTSQGLYWWNETAYQQMPEQLSHRYLGGKIKETLRILLERLVHCAILKGPSKCLTTN